jgi:hypothetical protein
VHDATYARAFGGVEQNLVSERLDATARALGETHLRRILREYAPYYNFHRSLDQDAPVSRPVQQIGRIVSHHRYIRILIFGTHSGIALTEGGQLAQLRACILTLGDLSNSATP